MDDPRLLSGGYRPVVSSDSMEGTRDAGGGRTGEALLSADEAARRLGVDRATVWRWCKEGRITCLKIGRLWRVRTEALEVLLKEADGPGATRSPE